MENEAEVIKEQMLETRTALTEKIEAVEQLVTSKVLDTTEAVAETVETVKDAVENTVATVTDTVHHTVESVKETFDLRHQVEKHPWAMLGGSVAIGYVGGALFDRAVACGYDAYGYAGRPAASTAYEPAPTSASQDYAPAREESRPGWGEKLLEALSPATTKLRELAVGAVAGLLGEMILNATPENLRKDVTEVIDSFTTSLGGKPIHSFGQGHDGQS